MSEPVTMALIGAGNRGRGIFGQYALDYPYRARFVAVVEPDAERRNAFAKAHKLPADRCFARHEDYFAAPAARAEAVVIATLENQRAGPLLAALAADCHALVEKPLANNVPELVRLCDAARASKRVVSVCHQMRYTPLFATLKGLVTSGAHGRIVSIQHSENVSFDHQAHSYTRGLFNRSTLSPLVLAKSCHDLDFLCFLTEAQPVRVASFGSLTYFRAENAPAGAPAHCLDGCPVETTCPYHVQRAYLGPDADPAYLRQMGAFEGRAELLERLKTNRFGRCVYRCDNDVVDNQVLSILFDNGVTASFAMCGLNAVERRVTKLSMTNGELNLDASRGEIEAHTFAPRLARTVRPTGPAGSHGGGDVAIMDAFTHAIRHGGGMLTNAAQALDSHLLALAAEESRRSGETVDIRAFGARHRQAKM